MAGKIESSIRDRIRAAAARIAAGAGDVTDLGDKRTYSINCFSDGTWEAVEMVDGGKRRRVYSSIFGQEFPEHVESVRVLVQFLYENGIGYKQDKK